MKILYFIAFFFILKISHATSSTNIVYLDIQFIIDNSEMGIFYRDKINKNNELLKSDLLIKENEIKIKEKEINDQKNILKKEEIDKKVEELNNLVKDFQIERNKLKNSITNDKKKYGLKILDLLNPLLTNYVEKNNINFVLDKKNILVGVKTKDITIELLNILNEKNKNEKLLNEN